MGKGGSHLMEYQDAGHAERAGFRVLEMTRYPERVLGEEIVHVWARRH